MPVLTPHLAFDATETAQSFAARLAAFHTGAGSARFLRDFGISQIALETGKAEAISDVAALAGIEAGDLFRNTPVPESRTTFSLRGHTVSSDFFVRPRISYCAACLQENDRDAGNAAVHRKQRWTWLLEVVRTCPDHGLSLVRRAKPGPEEMNEFAAGAPRAADTLQKEIGACVARDVSPLQAYCVARLEGHAGPAWLDAQPIDDVARASELLGATILFGTRVDLAALDDDQRDAAGTRGFGIMAGGASAVRDALAKIYRGFRNTGSKPGAQTVFGTLYKRVSAKRARSYGELTDVLRSFILDTFALDGGTVVLGETLEVRRLHTASSLAAEQTLDHRTLRHLLVSRGLLAADAQPHAAFDAEEGRAVAATIRRKVTVTSLPKALGCSRPLAEQVLAEGILQPLADDNPHGKGHARKAVFEDDVAAFQVRVEQAVTETVSHADGFVPIAKAAEKARHPAIDILHLILGGYLDRVVRIEGQGGLAGLRVHPDAVKAAIPAIAEGLSPTDAFSRLQIPVSSGWALVERGVLAVRSIEGPNGAHAVERFRAEDIERAAREFTTAARLGAKVDIPGHAVERMLRHARIRPAFSRADVGINLFRTADVAEVLPR